MPNSTPLPVPTTDYLGPATPALPAGADAIGAVVLVRPWLDGRRLDKPQRGYVVMGHCFEPGDDYVIVWFPQLGAPELGRSQQMMERKLCTVVTVLGALPKTWVIAAERMARKQRRGLGESPGWSMVAGMLLEAAAKTFRRIDRDARIRRRRDR